MVLGDHFPADAKREQIRKHLQPGGVVRLHCDFTNPPKPKLLVVACVEPQLLFFVINSEIPGFVQRRRHLQVCEVQIDRANHDFLDHDFYIDCQQAIDSFTPAEVEAALLRDMRELKGTISASVKDQVLAAVKACPVLPRGKKSWIIAALS